MRTSFITLLFTALITSASVAWSADPQSWRLVADAQGSPSIVEFVFDLDAPLMPPQQTGGVNGVPVDASGQGYSSVLAAMAIDGFWVDSIDTATAWQSTQASLFVRLPPSGPYGGARLMLDAPGIEVSGPVSLLGILQHLSAQAQAGQLRLTLMPVGAGIVTATVNSFTPLPEPSSASMVLLGMLAVCGHGVVRARRSQACRG